MGVFCKEAGGGGGQLPFLTSVRPPPPLKFSLFKSLFKTKIN